MRQHVAHEVGAGFANRRPARVSPTAARTHMVHLTSNRQDAGRLHRGRRMIACRRAAVVVSAVLVGYAGVLGGNEAAGQVPAPAATSDCVERPESPPKADKNDIIADILKGVALAVAGAMLAFYLKERPAERWKRTEYVRKAFQERYDSPGAKNASFLLYWPDRHIPLWDDDEKNRWTRVKDDEAAKAILPYVVHPFVFENPDFTQDKRRIALNDSFVDLIWRLDHVRVAAEAAKPEDVHEIIHELGELLDGERDATRLAPGGRLITSAFRLMLAWRKMHRLIQFFDRHGYDLRVMREDIDLLKQHFPSPNWTHQQIAGLEAEVPPRRAMHWRVEVLRELDRRGAAVTTFSWITTSARVITRRLFGGGAPAKAEAV